MTNHISFPKHYATYLQNAMVALADNKISEAADFMQEALKIEEDEELLQLCISLLKDLKRPKEALQLIKRQKPTVYDSQDISPFDLEFISLLIDNGQLEEARKQIKKRWIKLHNSPQKDSINQVLEHQFTYIETKIEQEKQEKRMLVIENGQTISKESYYHQLNFMKELPILSDFQLIDLVGKLLTENGVHYLVKTDMLELLQERQINETITVIKDSFKQSVNPYLMTSVYETKFVEEGRAVIENYTQLNEEEKRQYIELLILHAAYYFPFEEKAFRSPETWLQAVLLPGYDKNIDNYVSQTEKGLNALMT